MANGWKDESRSTKGWTSTQAYAMAIVCLLIGVAVGYFVHGSAGADVRPVAVPVAPAAPASQAPAMGGMAQQITREQLKQIAEAQAAPLLERLKREPRNAELLTDIGNLYYDSHQYQLAHDFYQRSLKIQPGNTNVRTDLGLTLWYLGDPDGAIEQFNTVLKAEPTKANALMDLGVVQWQGKMNIPAAVAAWEKLLATNPNFEGKGAVERLIAQAKRHSKLPPGPETAKPPM